MEEIKIVDESGDRKYFTQIPNYIANHSTANDQALYFQMKRYAGDDGKCFATQKTLRKKLSIGKQAYNKSLKYLLDKKWVRFVGMTGGKTRPIKTYAIVDIWKLNIMEYEKISPEMEVSFEKISPETDIDKSQNGTKISPRMALEEEPIKEKLNNKYNTCEQSSQDITNLINLFKSINPIINFGNKTVRKATADLINQFGKEKADEYARYAVSVFGKPYAPVITTPYDLREKLSKLVAFHTSDKNKKEKVTVTKTF